MIIGYTHCVRITLNLFAMTLDEIRQDFFKELLFKEFYNPFDDHFPDFKFDRLVGILVCPVNAGADDDMDDIVFQEEVDDLIGRRVSHPGIA